jgi:ferrochelatase
MKKIGILLSNIGTPDAPTSKSVRRFLKEFLSDPRVIELPQILWQPILRGIILTTRPRQSAALYQKVWRANGSPLLAYTMELALLLEKSLRQQYGDDIFVSVGMRYGNPSIESALNAMRDNKVERYLILPLFPQYSATTTAATFDAVQDTFKKWRHLPDLHTINSYADDADYIQGLAQSIKNHQTKNGQKHLLFSFHSIPQRYADKGDPYQTQCQLTAKLVATALSLRSDEWSMAYQSRLGPTKWLTPYTDKVLAAMPHQGIQDLQVVCPGFSVDCLETLEEIAIRGKEQFLESGGKTYEYIPALNCSHAHLKILSEMVSRNLQGWLETPAVSTSNPQLT